MPRLTDEELRREIEALVKRQMEEDSLIPSHEDPREFGRRIAREMFEKRVKATENMASDGMDAA